MGHTREEREENRQGWGGGDRGKPILILRSGRRRVEDKNRTGDGKWEGGTRAIRFCSGRSEVEACLSPSLSLPLPPSPSLSLCLPLCLPLSMPPAPSFPPPPDGFILCGPMVSIKVWLGLSCAAGVGKRCFRWLRISHPRFLLSSHSNARMVSFHLPVQHSTPSDDARPPLETSPLFS
ncbi:hypothetical protein IE53DRAFT_262595 [Violaceomyces palustris]|uniref:Uncharacterized protein n=1 Tax=Violaceomyces palustris TaxID=1673888 RepID=A0ACD0NN74_9BASI|nr:hypothetical protein IE53DRAFT_262595 [Violaceomyces palustris]